MPSYFNVTLDTTAPGGGSITLNGGAAYTSVQAATAVIHTSDGVQTGYQIKVWGDVDNSDNPLIQTTEGASSWITPTWSGGDVTQAIKLSTGDASKTINCKIRDDVWNETSTLSDSITLDTTVPVITIQTGPDATRISKISGKRTTTVTWQSDTTLVAYEVEVVSNSGSLRGSGTVIGTTNGSSNASGGAVNATTNVTTTIDGRDLDAASPGDGVKVIKIFGQDASGLWSIT